MKREENQYKKQSQHAYQINAEIEFLGAQNEGLEAPKWVLGGVLGGEISKKNTNHKKKQFA